MGRRKKKRKRRKRSRKETQQEMALTQVVMGEKRKRKRRRLQNKIITNYSINTMKCTLFVSIGLIRVYFYDMKLLIEIAQQYSISNEFSHLNNTFFSVELFYVFLTSFNKLQ